MAYFAYTLPIRWTGSGTGRQRFFADALQDTTDKFQFAYLNIVTRKKYVPILTNSLSPEILMPGYMVTPIQI